MTDNRNDFDQLLGRLTGLPEVASTKPTTLRSVGMLGIGKCNDYIVQSFRLPEDGDYVFLIHINGDEKPTRLILPPEVCDCIARHRDSMSSKNRSRAARNRAEADKAAGVVPAFMRKRKK